MRYVSDLHIGRIDPRLFHWGLDLGHEKYDLASLVRTRFVDAPDVTATFAEIEPPFPGYRRVQKALHIYLALTRDEGSKLLPVPKKPVDPGTPYPSAARLAQLLRKLGDLPADAVISEGSYESPLVDAVKRFQTRHALVADGRIGGATFRALNTPLSRRVRQLQLTLERYRWAPHHFGTPPIIVNIPEFRLRAMDDSFHAGLEMKVVVGRAYKTRTPVFAREMNFVIFRHFWHVPPCIQRKELAP
jgi:murein L,D-transpeptidase YcbB/YkuD